MTNPIPNKQLAVKAEHDTELAAMEAEVTKALETGAPDATTEDTANGEGTPTPAPTSAEGETKPLAEKDSAEEVKPEATPDMGKPTTPAATDDSFDDEDVKHLSEKAQKRFRQMNDELKRLKARENAQKFGPKPTSVPDTRSSLGKPSALPWDTQGENGPKEVTAEEYEAEVATKAREAVKLELKNQQIVTNVTEDRKYLETTYPELDQESEDFDPVLAENVATWYKALFRTNQDIRLKDFVEEVMSLRTKGVEKGKSEVTATVMRQAAEQAISPTTQRVVSKTAADAIAGARTMEELEAAEKLLS